MTGWSSAVGYGSATTIGRIDHPRILILCTGNQCRSPMAEVLLQSRLDERGVPVDVDSAGLVATGVPATDHAVSVLADMGLDLSAHRSRILHDVHPETADLILAMERRHLQEAILAAPEVRHRTFTLRDLVARAEDAPPRRPDESIAFWAHRLSLGRTHAELIGVGDDGIADPIGRDLGAYQATAAALDDLLERLVGRIFPQAASSEVA